MSTLEVAKLAGISKATLEQWLATGKIAMPKRIQVGRRVSRIWSHADIERVKNHKAKFYCKGRGRKKKG